MKQKIGKIKVLMPVIRSLRRTEKGAATVQWDSRQGCMAQVWSWEMLETQIEGELTEGKACTF